MAWCDEAASERGLCRVVLSTFRDVAWNGIWYARLGFDELPRRQILPWMATIEDAQAAAGLDITRRCFMARAVGR
jgi:4-diphosphocytidyl-2-C-methyl-D-erythritol kinase